MHTPHRIIRFLTGLQYWLAMTLANATVRKCLVFGLVLFVICVLPQGGPGTPDPWP
ncbi:hypothetical protein KSC_043700 [Ktedonobacter sp. SOSP1-52]|nr:hypothetical protein KSC_043700 [Ktedonobacter sp. SOSP1-52]